jgi:WD40 repeat protein
VLFLASELSINSQHCRDELVWARQYSTRIIPLLLDLSSRALEGIKVLDLELSGLHALKLRRGQMRTIAFEHEGRTGSVQLSAEALDRLVQDLREIDVQAADLPWPARDLWDGRRKTSDVPYPSLEAFGVDDGGIFFGRTADAIAVLNDLDRIHRDHTPPLFIVEAASGAGKSSFLQAGLWARLQYREDIFERVAIVRPAGGSITGPTGLFKGLVDYAERKSLPLPAELFEKLRTPLALRSLKNWLRQANPSLSTRTFLIGVDQGEELYTPGVDPEAGAFKSLIAEQMAETAPGGLGPRLLFIATIRSDSVEQLLCDAILKDVHPTTYGLKSIAVGDALADIVKRPAEKWSKRRKNTPERSIEVTDDLVRAIEQDMRDQPDALPLLAFALRQLFDQARASGQMNGTAYAQLGRLQRGIAVEFERSCADLGVTVFDPLVRELFVPHLATWDESAKAAKRLQFSLEDFKRLCSHLPRLKELADRLVKARLLVKTKATLEVAHEALLRQEPLASWMRKAQSDLLLRDQVFGEAREWAALKERDEVLAETRGLARTAARLEAAEALFEQPDFAHYSDRVSAYLLACRGKWNAEVLRTRRLSAATFGPAIREALSGPPRQPDRAAKYLAAAMIEAEDNTLASLPEIAREARRAVSEAQLLGQSEVLDNTVSWCMIADELFCLTRDRQVSLVSRLDGSKSSFQPFYETRLSQPALFDTYDGATLAIVSGRGEVEFIDARTGEETGRHDEAAGALACAVGHAGQMILAFQNGNVSVVAGRGAPRFYPGPIAGKIVALAPLTGSRKGFIILGQRKEDVTREEGSAKLGLAVIDQSSDAITQLPDLDFPARHFTVQPRGNLVAAFGNDQSVRLFDLEHPDKVKALQHLGAIRAARFSPNGKILAVASEDGQARLWDVSNFSKNQTAETLARLTGHEGAVTDVQFYRGAAFVLTTTEGGTMRLWSTLPESLLGDQRLLARFENTDTIEKFWPALTAMEVKTVAGPKVRTWDAATGIPRSILIAHRRNQAGNRVEVEQAVARFRIDDTLIYSIGSAVPIKQNVPVESLICVSSASTGDELSRHALNKKPRSISLSSDGSLLAVGCENAEVLIFRTDSMDQPNVTLPIPYAGERRPWVGAVQLHTETGRLLTTSSDGFVRVWSTETWQEVIPPFDKHNAGDNVRGAAFSVDGRWIATASFDRSGFIFNSRTGQPLKHLKSVSSFFRSAAFAPALEPGQSVPFLLTSHADNRARLWDVEAETVIGEFLGHDDQVMGAVFSPDGERVATASYDGTARVWDVKSRTELLRLQFHVGWVTSVTFDSTGQLLITTGRDGFVVVWDVAKTREIARRPIASSLLAYLQRGLAFVDDRERRDPILADTTRVPRDLGGCLAKLLNA